MSTLEKYAQDLAIAATSGKKESLVAVVQPFTKHANRTLSELLKDPTVQRYLMGGLGGAGLGALIGYMQPDRKKRKALNYGLMGGLGGLGLAHLLAGGVGGQSAASNSSPAAPTTAEKVVDSVAQTAPHVPEKLITPMTDLPDYQPVGNVLLDAPGNAGQIIRDNIPRINEQSPLATVAGAVPGYMGGKRLGNRASGGVNSLMKAWNTAAMNKTRRQVNAATALGMSPAGAQRVLSKQLGRNKRWGWLGRGLGALVNAGTTAGGVVAGAQLPSMATDAYNALSTQPTK